MPQSQCLKIRMKPGMTEKFLEWAKRIPNRMGEVRTCMFDEGVIAEHIFLERSPSGDFIVFYTKARDLAKVGAAFQSSKRKLDLEMIETTWDRSQVVALEPVIDL